MMKIKNSDKSIIFLDDYKKDSSNKRVYRMRCKTCLKDRGYKRPASRILSCMSCGQIGKKSSRKGKKLTDKQKQNIKDASLKWRKSKDPNYKPLSDVDKKIMQNIRIRLWQLVKSKPESLSRSIGCKSYELKMHLESQFQKGMNWDNYGRKNNIRCWEIDHIKPLASFDLTNKKQFREACHYTNLQPLWVSDNRSKGSKYEQD